MSAFMEGLETFPEACRSILQVGINAMLSSLLLCLLGIGIGQWLRAQGRPAQVLVYKATFCAILSSGLLAVGMAEHLKPLWRLSLPLTHEYAVPPLPLVETER